VVVIDPGHGGETAVGGSSPNNAIGPNKLLEKNLTLDIARRVQKLLALTADVRLTRSGDTNLSLADRAKLARTSDAQIFLSIHMNGFHNAQVDGTEVWVARQANEQSRRFAATVLERLTAVTGVASRGVKQRDLGVLLPARHAPTTAACLVEVAFLTNPAQARRLESEDYKQAIAKSLAEAIYLGIGGRASTAQSLAASIGGYGATNVVTRAYQVAYEPAATAATAPVSQILSAEIPLDPGAGGMSLHPDALEVGDIIVSTTGAFISNAIKLLTSGQVSHAFIYTGKNGKGEHMGLEAIGSGVVERKLTESLDDATLAVAFRHPSMTTALAAKIVAFARKQLGKIYNYYGIVKQAKFQLERTRCYVLPSPLREACDKGAMYLNLGAISGVGFFCSELVLAAFQDAGLPLTDKPPHWGSPKDIADLRLAAKLKYVGHLIAPPLAASKSLASDDDDDAYSGALTLAPAAAPKPPPALNAWTRLISFRPPTAVQKELKGRGFLKGWYAHPIEDANGPVNLDYYPVRVTKLPVIKGRTIPAEDLFDHIRRNLNDFVDNRVSEFKPLSQKDHDRFYGDDPVGAVFTIKMKLGGRFGVESGSVVVSEASAKHWIFATAWTSEDNDHPVSGNREFGYKPQDDGSFIFYTRGADRPTGILDMLMYDAVFNTAHTLWLSLQDRIAEFVNNNGGAASDENPSSRRYEWDAVKDWYFSPSVSWLGGAAIAKKVTPATGQSLGADAHSLGASANPCAALDKPCQTLDKFEFDSDKLSPEHELKLIDIAKCVLARRKSADPVASMLIVGHTDAMGTEKYNQALGQRRAERVKSHMVNRLEEMQPGSSKGIVFVVDTGGEAEPTGGTAEHNRRVEICLPRKIEPPPPPQQEKKPTLEDVVGRCQGVLDSQPFPAEQKARLQCLLKNILDKSVDDHYINGLEWYYAGYLAKGRFDELTPKDFAAFLLHSLRRNMLHPLFAAQKVTDAVLSANLKKMDERILAGVKLVENQTHRNAELNFKNPVLRQMQGFISGQQRNTASIYHCYR
jgi:outer membrane protein OmpA-like peptidoglycan-associated protein/cell wall-associated NlpC family hydrolase